MPWIYKQSNGQLFHNHIDGPLIDKGYAGREEGKDNPFMQSVAGIGPLPRGNTGLAPHFIIRTLGRTACASRRIPEHTCSAAQVF